MRFPGNGWPVDGSRMADAFVAGSRFVDVSPVKSPLNWAGVGTSAVIVLLRRLRSDSQFAKKNSRFLIMGPPALAPN